MSEEGNKCPLTMNLRPEVKGTSIGITAPLWPAVQQCINLQPAVK